MSNKSRHKKKKEENVLENQHSSLDTWKTVGLCHLLHEGLKWWLIIKKSTSHILKHDYTYQHSLLCTFSIFCTVSLLLHIPYIKQYVHLPCLHSGLCKWILALEVYDRVAKVVAPKKEKLREAEEDLARMMENLNAKRAELALVQKKLEDLKNTFSEMTDKKQKLEFQV